MCLDISVDILHLNLDPYLRSKGIDITALYFTSKDLIDQGFVQK